VTAAGVAKERVVTGGRVVEADGITEQRERSIGSVEGAGSVA
jgi:hypothetical protein